MGEVCGRWQGVGVARRRVLAWEEWDWEKEWARYVGIEVNDVWRYDVSMRVGGMLV